MNTLLDYRSPGAAESIQVFIPRPISFRGFPNIGNTCFLNAALNAFYSSQSFVDFCYQDEDDNRRPLLTALKTLYQRRFSADCGSELRHILDLFPGFNDYKQHCAHSFMLTLLSTLDKELPDSSQVYEQQIDSLVKRYRVKKCGKLHDLFFVLMEYVFTCNDCYHGFSTSVYSRTLSLPIPEKYVNAESPEAALQGYILFEEHDYFDPEVYSAGCAGFSIDYLSEYYRKLLISARGGRRWKTLYSREDPCPLSTLFQYLFRQSLMTVHNKLYCINCNKETQHIKQSFLRQTGNVLILHLQRYSETTQRKETLAIEYPERLDLRKFECGEFQLFAVISHRGSLESGHYYANVRVDDRWIRLDDDRVDSTDRWDPSAYILFYSKVS